MLRNFLAIGSLALLLAMLAPVQPVAHAALNGAAQAIPLHPGFPNRDPKIITFASPSVADIDGDGQPDVLTADGAGCVWAWDHNGNRLPGFPWQTVGACDVSARINGPLAVGDIDGDGRPEVVAGTRGTGTAAGQRGRVFVWHADGTLLPGWPKEMDWNPAANGAAEVYSVALANIAGDSRLEVLAGTSNNSKNADDTNTPNLYAWSADGKRVPGFPTAYRAAGIYGAIAAADLNGDGLAEVVAARGHPYLHAYGADGQQLQGWPVRTYLDVQKTDYHQDAYMEYTQNSPVLGDLDGDGSVELIVAGGVRDPLKGYDITKSGVLVVEPDGQRRDGWAIPKLSGAPLASDYPPSQAPALADLDGDGRLEIVVALADGTIRAYRADGSELWVYNYAQGKRLFASEPVIGDVTGDGKLDIVFGTYSPDGSADSAARVLGLDAQGRPLAGFPLALTEESGHDKQGVRAAPTLADLDGNGTLELLVGSQAGALYVWDLPAPFNADRLPWPTGRHDNLRSGAAPRSAPSTLPPTATASPTPSATATSSPLNTATPDTNGGRKNITFENGAGNLTDPTTGVDTVRQPVGSEHGAPIDGAYAARFNNTTDGYLQERIAATDAVFVTFALRITSLPDAARIVMIRSGGRTIGNIQLMNDGTLRLRNYETVIGASSAPLRVGSVYRIGLAQQKGSGNNAMLAAYLAAGSAPFGSPFAATTSDTFTTQADAVRIGATNNQRVDAVVDTITIDTTLPAGITEPIPTAAAATATATAAAATATATAVPATATATAVPATATTRATATPRATSTATPRATSTATPRATSTATPRATATTRVTSTATPRATATTRATSTVTPRATTTPPPSPAPSTGGAGGIVSFVPQPIRLDAPEIINPMRGLYQWRTAEYVPLPRPAYDSYDRYEWRTLEPTLDRYDFSEIERDVVRAAREGRKFSFRIRTLVSGSGSAVPDYLMQRMAKGWWADSNRDGVRDTYVPDWNDPYFLDRVSRLLNALGARYNRDPRIAWVDIGIFGNWGEWHTAGFSYPSQSGALRITTANKYRLVDMHISAFPDTFLVSMTDDADALVYAMSRSPRIGWRRDSLGWSNGHFEQIERDTTRWNAIKDRWKTAPVVTEFCNPSFQDDPSVFQLSTEEVKRYHISLVSNGNSLRWPDLSASGKASYTLLGKTAGYRLALDRVALPGTLRAGSQFAVDTSWSNLGVAPTYEPWQVMVQMRPAGTDTVAWQSASSLNLNSVLPTSDAQGLNHPLAQNDRFTLPSDLAAGAYDLVLVIRSHGSNRAPLALAIQGMRSDGSYRLGTVAVR